MNARRMAAAFRSHWQIIALCAVLLFGVVIPMCSVQTMLGHDVYYHMTRMESVAQELKNGNIPTRLYYFVYDGYGYASPMFYGDLFLYIPAALILMGMPMPLAYKAFMIICVCACALTSYYCGRKMFGSRTAALIVSVSYAFSSYFAVDTFTRAANGEMQAFVFVPLAFLGLYGIIEEDGKYWYFLPLGLAAVLVSHLLTAAMLVFFLFVYALISLPKLIKKPKGFIRIAVCAAVFLLVAACFLMPLVEQLVSAEFLSTDGTSATKFGTMAERALTPMQTISLLNMKTDNDPWIPNGIGYLPLALLLFRLVMINKIRFCRGDVFLILSFFCLFASSSLFPWDLFQSLLGTLQFPWRIMLFATLFTALSAGDYFRQIPAESAGAFTAAVCVLSLCAFGSVYVPRMSTYAGYEQSGYEVVYYKGINIGGNIGVGEYLPSGTDRGKMLNRGNVVTSDGTGNYRAYQEDGGDLYVAVEYGDGMGTYLDLPLIMYKGYSASFITAAGAEIPLETDYGENNVLRVYLDGVTESGTVYVTYSGTAVQHVSAWISAISCIALSAAGIYFSCRKAVRKRSQTRTPSPEAPELSSEAPRASD